MKSPPLASLTELEPLGVPRNVVAVNDGTHRSHVEWRMGGPRLAPEPSTPLPARARDTDGAGPCRVSADDTDADSAERAYQLWKGRVWRFAGRLGVPSEQLEDATQDVFTAVFRRWEDFRGQSTRRTWVLGFVPRVASSYRRRRRHPACPSSAPDEDGALAAVSGGDHDPFESAARREAKRVVSRFLDSLPELDRQLFVLVDLEDASVVEAAAILELGPRRAYKILDRARRALEATLVRQRAADGWRLP